MKIIILALAGAFYAAVVLMIYCCCIVSGRCSRAEELEKPKHT